MISNAWKGGNMEENKFKYVSRNTIKNLSLHDCDCKKFYYQNNKLVFEMEWMEVLANHPLNPYNKAHQSGISKIELINPKYLSMNKGKYKEWDTLIPIEYSSLEEINNNVSNINISETIEFSKFDESKIGNNYCLSVYAVYWKNTNYDAIEMKIIYEESIVSFNKLENRKLNVLFDKIDLFEPVMKDNVYEEFVVPSNNFLDESPNSIKRKFILKWLEITEKFIKHKDNNKFCKIVGMIVTNGISCSRIILFFDEEYYNNFWKRENSYQTWKRLDSEKSLKQRLNIQTNLKEIGFKETLNDDDFKYETELWFYGEL